MEEKDNTNALVAVMIGIVILLMVLYLIGFHLVWP